MAPDKGTDTAPQPQQEWKIKKPRQVTHLSGLRGNTNCPKSELGEDLAFLDNAARLVHVGGRHDKTVVGLVTVLADVETFNLLFARDAHSNRQFEN